MCRVNWDMLGYPGISYDSLDIGMCVEPTGTCWDILGKSQMGHVGNHVVAWT